MQHVNTQITCKVYTIHWPSLFHCTKVYHRSKYHVERWQIHISHVCYPQIFPRLQRMLKICLLNVWTKTRLILTRKMVLRVWIKLCLEHQAVGNNQWYSMLMNHRYRVYQHLRNQKILTQRTGLKPTPICFVRIWVNLTP